MRARSITRVARSPVLQSQATANFPGPSGRLTSFQPVPWQNWQFSSGIVERAYGRGRRTARFASCGILCKKNLPQSLRERKDTEKEKDSTQGTQREDAQSFTE